MYPIYGMYDEASRAWRDHEDECDDCRFGNWCDVGKTLLERGRSLAASIEDGLPEREDCDVG